MLRFVIARSDGLYGFWAAPGGEVEPGETDASAAQRELLEELSLTVNLQVPVHTVQAEFEYEGYWNISTEVFFQSRWDGTAPTLAGINQVERDALREWKWWSVNDILQSDQPIFPADLAEVLVRLSTIDSCRT